jgi:acetyl-CoA carboxylase alpha subunit
MTLNVKRVLAKHLKRLRRKSIPALLEERFEKFRKIGVFNE